MNRDLAIDVCRRLVALEGELFDEHVSGGQLSEVTWENCEQRHSIALAGLLADARRAVEEHEEAFQRTLKLLAEATPEQLRQFVEIFNRPRLVPESEG